MTSFGGSGGGLEAAGYGAEREAEARYQAEAGHQAQAEYQAEVGFGGGGAYGAGYVAAAAVDQAWWQAYEALVPDGVGGGWFGGEADDAYDMA
jgi:hypothetical protein